MLLTRELSLRQNRCVKGKAVSTIGVHGAISFSADSVDNFNVKGGNAVGKSNVGIEAILEELQGLSTVHDV